MRVTMIGAGYVGLVSGACFADFGHVVTCVDKDQGKIDRLKDGVMPIFEPGLAELVENNVKEGRLSFTLDAASAARFGLRDGEVYEIRVFHAERKVEGSSFKLTLSGFDASPSDCVPDCGDGVVTAGEECDDGVNDGGYEQCGEGCKLVESCGDGIVQPEEDCDDGNREDGDECGSSCRNLVVD